MENIKKIDIVKLKKERLFNEEDMVVVEYPYTIFLNDEELITLLCTPTSIEYLTVGFLYSEGLIESTEEIKNIRIDTKKGIGYVNIKEGNIFNEKLKGKRTTTSGCGKGSIFYNALDSFKSKKIEKPLSINVNQVIRLMQEFTTKSELFLKTGGVHSCAISSLNDIIIFDEDIGRHNALDKVIGKALVENIDLTDKIILTSGRVSSEILIKVAKNQVPILVSRSAPTSLAVEIAKKLNITLIGFVRGEKMNIYSNFPRLYF